MPANTIKITRQLSWGKLKLLLPHTSVDDTNEFSVGEMSVSSVMEAKNLQENIVILLYDVISVPKAALVYVVGEVRRWLRLMVFTAPRSSMILPSGKRVEIPVKLTNLLLQQDLYTLDDILFIPISKTKKAGYWALETALQITTGLSSGAADGTE